MSLLVLAPGSDIPSLKSPRVDPTISTLGEMMAGVLLQVWCMAQCYMVTSLSRSCVEASKPSVLSYTLVARKASRCSALGIPAAKATAMCMC